MKYSTLALFATAVVAADEAFNLRVVSDNTDIDGAGLTPVGEGAGINYFLLGEETGPEFHYNAEDARLYQVQDDEPAHVGAHDGFLQVGLAVEPSEITFDDGGVLKISEPLWACKGLEDPSEHFVEDYGIAAAAEAPNDSCHAIALCKEGVKKPAPSQDGWNQTTVTKDVTVTGYTTYCPEPTTFTVTTCYEKVCAPSTVVVEEPKTVTITEECIIEKTTTKPVKPTTKPEETKPPKETKPEETKPPKETKPEETKPAETKPIETEPAEETTPTTVAAPSSVANVTSTFEGVGMKNAAGFAAGAVGVAALLI